MHYHEQKAAIVRQYMIEPIASRHLTELERINHVIAELNTLTAKELGFETYGELKNTIGIPTTRVASVGHERVWDKPERRRG